MANEENVRRLRQGSAAWNEWRARIGFIWPDLSGADLGRANLDRADLSFGDPCRAAQSKAPAAAAIGSVRLTNRQGQLFGVVQGREGADTGRAARINVSQADGVAAIRIDIAAG
jgi:uncharacterized protein YjbI with pentapeptide repeats